MTNALFDNLARVWSGFHDKALHLFPRLMAALVIFGVGWILALIFRAAFKRGARLIALDTRCEHSGFSLLLRRAEIGWKPTEALGKCGYWILLVSAAIFSLSALEMPILDRMVEAFFLYLPKLFVAVGILALGFLLANFLSRAALLLAVNEDLPVPRLVAGTVRLLVNVLAFAMAMEQLGIARNTVTVAFAIAFGALMLALALAFGLGGRDLARALLARRLNREDADQQDDLHHL